MFQALFSTLPGPLKLIWGSPISSHTALSWLLRMPHSPGSGPPAQSSLDWAGPGEEAWNPLPAAASPVLHSLSRKEPLPDNSPLPRTQLHAGVQN